MSCIPRMVHFTEQRPRLQLYVSGRSSSWGQLYVPTIGDRIKEVREKRERTQEWLAKETGISKGFLSEIENNKGTGNIGADYVIRISNALGVSLDYLLRGEVAQQDVAREPVK